MAKIYLIKGKKKMTIQVTDDELLKAEKYLVTKNSKYSIVKIGKYHVHNRFLIYAEYEKTTI